MAMEVGDAVLHFLGDSSQLDTKFSQVEPNAEKAFGRGADRVEEGTKRMSYNIREAQGEARLLGEEFGIHLPRHVSTFLAKIPGVGEALSAAFSATAILFVAQALVQATEKATAFIVNNLVYTQAMKDSNAATVETNKTLIALSENYSKAKDSIEKFGASGSDSMRLQLEALKSQIANTKNTVLEGEKNNQQQRQVTHEYMSQTGWLALTYDKAKAIVTGGKTQIETIKAQTTAIQDRVLVDSATVKALQEQEALLEKQLTTQHKIEAIKQGGETQLSGAKLKAAQAQAEVAEDSQTAQKRQMIAEQLENTLYTIKRAGMLKQLAVLKENAENTKDAQVKLLAEMKVAADNQATVVLERLVKAKDELQKALQDIAKGIQNAPPIEPITPVAIQNMIKGVNVAHDLGITLRGDLVQAYVAAKKAQDDFMASGIKDGVAQTAIANNILKAKAALEAYGHVEDRFKARSHGLWNEFRQDTKAGATAMDQVKQIGVTAFDDLSRGLEQAIASALLAQGGFTKALEKATASALASIASQAIVKALFYTAEGFAAMASFNEGSATAYFTAAGEMAAVGAAAGLAAHGLAGAGGGSGKGSTAQGHNSESNTGQSNRSVGVQGFAKGALVTEPTLAIIGEDRQNPTEAVLPLDDDRAMGKIREGLGSNGGNHFHFHGPVIGQSDVVPFVKHINRAVNKGQVHLTASNSFKLTKRSA